MCIRDSSYTSILNNLGRTICNTIKTIIGDKSKSPVLGKTLRTGASSGSVILNKKLLTESPPLGDIQDINTLPKIAKVNTVDNK